MEYIKGGSLADKLKEQKLSNHTALNYLEQILGVNLLHAKSIYSVT